MQFDKLNLSRHQIRNWDYKEWTEYIFQPFDDLMHDLKFKVLHDPENLNAYVLPRLKKSWFKRKSQYFLTLDCDSPQNGRRATKELDRRNIKYIIIESSPDHFWIVCDYVDTLANIVHIMEEIPGCDIEYIKFCWNGKYIPLRAFLKSPHFPVFHGMDQLDQYSSQFQEWIRQFEAYWKTPDMQWIQIEQFVHAIS
jgi:hypothetical protein